MKEIIHFEKKYCQFLIKILVLITVLISCSPIPIKEYTSKYIYFRLENPPLIGKNHSQQDIYLGGFSGLLIESNNDNYIDIISITDRGPNAGEIEYLSGVGKKLRPFVLPDYTPRIVKLRMDKTSEKVEVVQQLLLKQESNFISGLPQGNGEIPITLNGVKIKDDRDGIDPESICKTTKDTYWVAEEYGPDLLNFDIQGMLLYRARPGEGLPRDLQMRKLNRGFEGVACSGSKIYAILQSPLAIPNIKNKLLVRLIEFDSLSKKTTGEFAYLLDSEKTDKIGDITMLPNGDFLVIEQDGKIGPDSNHKIYSINLKEASNLSTSKVAPELIDSQSIVPIKKTLVVDLVKNGFDFAEKMEGLAVIDANTLIVAVDNDFGLDGQTDLIMGTVPIQQNRKSLFAIIKLERSLW